MRAADSMPTFLRWEKVVLVARGHKQRSHRFGICPAAAGYSVILRVMLHGKKRSAMFSRALRGNEHLENGRALRLSSWSSGLRFSFLIAYDDAARHGWWAQSVGL